LLSRKQFFQGSAKNWQNLMWFELELLSSTSKDYNAYLFVVIENAFVDTRIHF